MIFCRTFTTTPVAAVKKIMANRNLKVYIDDIRSCPVFTAGRPFFSIAESGIESSTMNMKLIMDMVPQKNEIRMASFCLTS